METGKTAKGHDWPLGPHGTLPRGRRISARWTRLTVGGCAATHSLEFLRHGAKRQASFLAIRTERRQGMQVERRTEVHVPDDRPIIRERGRAPTDLPAHL